ncbi:barstar family protein [Paenibacillus sp. S-38]|uniref:barstar family protein n=1 Tax=Paenibacillus sp. S-38 TaxID=3416710 RepID=UPI003CE79E66
MGYKYSIVDDENDKVLGFCNEVEIHNVNDEGYTKLKLHGFILTNEFMEISTIKLSNFRLNVLSKDGQSLGGYNFFPNKELKINSMDTSEDKSIEIVGGFSTDPLPFAFEVWERLREKPTELGQWKNCSLEEKQAWLQVLRLISHKNLIDREDEVITIEGDLILDVETFFIAIGEAINGPFGYYGADLDGIDDCLCGGFGLIPPFILEWRNFDKSFGNEFLGNSKFVFLLLNILTSRGCDVHLKRSTNGRR